MKPPIQLAPPGAGLPKWRLFFIRPLFLVASKNIPRKKFTHLYEKERRRILKLVETLNEEAKSTQTLIPQIAGIEDSSRFWSIYMTLEHLTIVDAGLSQIITQLCRSEVVERAVKVKDVKPSENTDTKAEKAFRITTAKTLKQLKTIPSLDENRLHEHPWSTLSSPMVRTPLYSSQNSSTTD